MKIFLWPNKPCLSLEVDHHHKLDNLVYFSQVLFLIISSQVDFTCLSYSIHLRRPPFFLFFTQKVSYIYTRSFKESDIVFIRQMVWVSLCQWPCFYTCRWFLEVGIWNLWQHTGACVCCTSIWLMRTFLQKQVSHKVKKMRPMLCTAIVSATSNTSIPTHLTWLWAHLKTPSWTGASQSCCHKLCMVTGNLWISPQFFKEYIF